MSKIRKDLDFLYERAMRSQDFDFMEQVYEFLVDAGMGDKAENLSDRIHQFLCNEFNSWPSFSKVDFLLADSQLGNTWYQNRR